MTATNTKAQIAKAMRDAIPARGAKNELPNLTDDQLWQLFLKWRGGESTASIAMWSHDHVNSGRSLDSWNTSLKRFKKRIAHILVALPLADPARPAAGKVLPLTPAQDFSPTTDLARLDVLIRDYHELITGWTKEAKETGIVNKDLAKHQQAMAALLKTKDKLETSARSRPPEPVISPERQASLQGKWSALTGLSNVDKMEAAIDECLLQAEEHVMTLEEHPDGSHTIRPPTESERIKDLALGICGGLAVKPGADLEEIG